MIRRGFFFAVERRGRGKLQRKVRTIIDRGFRRSAAERGGADVLRFFAEVICAYLPQMD